MVKSNAEVMNLAEFMLDNSDFRDTLRRFISGELNPLRLYTECEIILETIHRNQSEPEGLNGIPGETL